MLRTPGYVKMHRKMIESASWRGPNEFTMAMVLLVKANWQDKEWAGPDGPVVVKRGQLVTSVAHLASACRMSVQSVRTALSYLERTQYLTKHSTKRYTIITVVKYNEYQAAESEANNQVNKPPTTTKGIKEVKELKTTDRPSTGTNRKATATAPTPKLRNRIPPSLADVTAYCLERKNGIDPQKFINFYEVREWRVGKTQVLMRNWQAAVHTWEEGRKEQQNKAESTSFWDKRNK